jgi:anti-sigma28 factor (negative regulator of flagellin synthesis)
MFGVWGKVAQTMYTHVSKCKNDKIKKMKKRRMLGTYQKDTEMILRELYWSYLAYITRQNNYSNKL